MLTKLYWRSTMAAVTSTDECPVPLSDEVLERNEFIATFWDTYQDSSIELAGRYFQNQVNGNIEVTKLLVPYLVEEGYKRGVDMKSFMIEMMDVKLEEKTNAVRTTDDGGRIPAGSDHETDNAEDETQPAQERDADSEGDSK